MIKDQENYPIAVKIYNLLWYILFDVLYEFLRDCIIFRRFMLFLVCTFWFVKIKRKKTVTVTSILIYFKEIYRKHALIGPSQSLKITSQKVAPFKLYQLLDQIIYIHCYETISFERLNRVHDFKSQESTKQCENAIFL